MEWLPFHTQILDDHIADNQTSHTSATLSTLKNAENSSLAVTLLST
jgi:hypothetical protein